MFITDSGGVSRLWKGVTAVRIEIVNTNLSTHDSPNWHVEILIHDGAAPGRVDYKLGGQRINWEQRVALLGYGSEVQELIREALNRDAR